MKAFISSRITPEWFIEIEKNFSEVEHYDWFTKGKLSAEEFKEKISDCHLVATESDDITAEILDNAEKLFAIVDFRGTVINVDIEAATKNGVVIMNTPGRNADAVADLTVALMIMIGRKLLRGIDAFRNNLWEEKGKYWVYQNHQGVELPGRTVGLVGLGAIGKLVIKRLAGFDVKLIGYDPFVSKEEALEMGVEKVTLEEVFSQADFLSLHLPLNAKTRGIFGEKELKLMKPEAFLINTSRAAVFQEDALIHCMQEGWIAGAALDVYHKEPLGADYPLVNLPNVICVPHLGGATTEVINHQSRIGVTGLLDFMRGKDPSNIINPDAIAAARARMNTYSEEGS